MELTLEAIILMVLKLVGGIALFLYGMNVMGDGLTRTSGGRLEKILEKLTSNTIKGILLGAGVTAIIQSSSATTVMVVGFVNSGIMTLERGAGIIIGANIGTTITSWLISLTSISGDSFILQMLKPSSFTPILAVVGIIFVMFLNNDKKRNVGLIFVGFAVLMTGMDVMSDAVSGLKDSPEFANLFTIFMDNPILGMLTGLILTAIIQSSSASVGILQALTVTGAITFGGAIPIVLGQNIGTCVTAMIASIGTKKEAKRAAYVHLYYNVISMITFMIVFYSLDSFLHFGFMNDTTDAVGVAVIHTLYNVFKVVTLAPFNKFLVKLARITVKDNDQKQDKSVPEHITTLRMLDNRFLETPAVAINYSKEVANAMARLSIKNLNDAFNVLKNYDEKTAQLILDEESFVDEYEDKLGTYLLKISSASLNDHQTHMLSKILHSINDFERISDHAVNILDSAREMNNKKLKFSESAAKELSVVISAVSEITSLALDSFVNNDESTASLVEPLEQVVDELKTTLRRRHVLRLQRGECTIELGFVLTDLLTNLERISDHCSNIAVCEIEVDNNSFDTHSYLRAIKAGEQKYQNDFKLFSQKYSL